MLKQQYDQAKKNYVTAENAYNSAKTDRDNAQSNYNSAHSTFTTANSNWTSASTAYQAVENSRNDNKYFYNVEIGTKHARRHFGIKGEPYYTYHQERRFNDTLYNKDLSDAQSRLTSAESAKNSASSSLSYANSHLSTMQTNLTNATTVRDDALAKQDVSKKAWEAEEKRIQEEFKIQAKLKAEEESRIKKAEEEKLKLEEEARIKLAEERLKALKIEEDHKNALLSNIEKLDIDLDSPDSSALSYEEILQLFASKYSALSEESKTSLVMQLIEKSSKQQEEFDLLTKALDIGVNIDLLTDRVIESNSVAGMEFLLSSNVDFGAKIISIINDSKLNDEAKIAKIQFIADNMPKDSDLHLEAEHQLSLISDQKEYDMTDLDISEINLLGRESIGPEDIS